MAAAEEAAANASARAGAAAARAAANLSRAAEAAEYLADNVSEVKRTMHYSLQKFTSRGDFDTIA